MTPCTRRGLLLGLPLAGCVSPEPGYYRLTPVLGVPLATGSGTVKLRRVGLPGYLDRPEIVRAGVGAKLEVLEGVRWAEPLGGMVGRVLAENLEQRLPGRVVLDGDGALSADADLVVEVELLRFEAGPSRAIELAARVGLFAGRNRLRIARGLRATGAVEGAGAAAVAAAMSDALGCLSDQVATLVAAT